MRKIIVLTLSFVLVPLFLLVGCGSGEETSTSSSPSVSRTTPPNFKVAFIGDQALGKNSKAVLQLIKEEGTDMVIHSGDFDYKNNPDKWDQQINDVLGPNFPYLGLIGNHEVRG